MPYTLACFRELHALYKIDIHVIRWDQKTLTPFQLQSEIGITFYNRSSINVSAMKQLLDRVNPDILYIVGRMDPGYLKIALYARRKKIPTISGWDNQWEGSLRNNVASIGSRWLYERYFDFIMVAGIWQYEYVRRIGYPRANIIFDQYSCDFELFNNAFKIRKANNFNHSKKILFIGRLTESKGVMLLISAFNQIIESYPDWKLIIVGNGDLKQKIEQSPQVQVIDFSDQAHITELLIDCTF